MHSKSIIAVVGAAGLANGAAIDRRQLGGGFNPLDMVGGLFGGGGGGQGKGYSNGYPDSYGTNSYQGGRGGGFPDNLLGGGGGGGFNPFSMVSGLTSGLGGLGKRDNQAKQGFDAFLPGGQFDRGQGFFKREEQAKAEAQDTQDTQDAQHWNDPCTQGCTQYCQQFLFDQADQCVQQCPQECQHGPNSYGNNQGGFGNGFDPNTLSDPTSLNDPNFVGGPSGPSGWGNGRLRGYGNNNNNFGGPGNVLSDPASQAFCHIFDRLSGEPNWSDDQQFDDQQFGNQQWRQQSQCPLWQNQGNPFQNGGRPGFGSPAFNSPNNGGPWNNGGFGGRGNQFRPTGYGNNLQSGGAGF